MKCIILSLNDLEIQDIIGHRILSCCTGNKDIHLYLKEFNTKEEKLVYILSGFYVTDYYEFIAVIFETSNDYTNETFDLGGIILYDGSLYHYRGKYFDHLNKCWTFSNKIKSNNDIELYLENYK